MFDWQTAAITFLSSVGLSLAAVKWLTARLIDHRLSKDIRAFQETLDEKLATAKAALDEQLVTKKVELDKQAGLAKSALDAQLRRHVDEYLGDRAADREYHLEARKRLYAAVGPLRFQLISASVDFANRVHGIGTGAQQYDLSLKGYFGRSTAFRLLKLFALTELVERQVAHADFSVDPTIIDLLRFKYGAFRCLSSGAISLKHPRVNWNHQEEHVFYDTLSIISSALIIFGADGTERAIRFDEFTESCGDTNWLRQIHPIPRLLDGFTPKAKPILWIRLVALGQLCSTFAKRINECWRA